MRKMALVMVCAVAVAFFACKNGTNSARKIPLAYDSVSGSGKFLHATVKLKETGKRVIWFQLFDQYKDKKLIDNYAKEKDAIFGYPAKIFKDKWIWVLVGKRFEIRLMADSQNKTFQNTEKLKYFIKSFDLKAMKNFSGPKLEGKDMKKFIPKL